MIADRRVSDGITLTMKMWQLNSNISAGCSNCCSCLSRNDGAVHLPDDNDGRDQEEGQTPSETISTQPKWSAVAALRGN